MERCISGKTEFVSKFEQVSCTIGSGDRLDRLGWQQSRSRPFGRGRRWKRDPNLSARIFFEKSFFRKIHTTRIPSTRDTLESTSMQNFFKNLSLGTRRRGASDRIGGARWTGPTKSAEKRWVGGARAGALRSRVKEVERTGAGEGGGEGGREGDGERRRERWTETGDGVCNQRGNSRRGVEESQPTEQPVRHGALSRMHVEPSISACAAHVIELHLATRHLSSPTRPCLGRCGAGSRSRSFTDSSRAVHPRPTRSIHAESISSTLGRLIGGYFEEIFGEKEGGLDLASERDIEREKEGWKITWSREHYGV